MSTKKDISLSFEPIITQRASEAIYEQIRDRIVNGDIAPGERLPSERKLIELFGRSRPTIREALRMLEKSGLIKIIPGSGGAVVNELNTDSIEQPLENMLLLQQISPEQIYEFRVLIEIAYCGWAAKRRTEQDIKNISQILKQSELSLNNLSEFLELDLKFHRQLALASGNALAGIVDNVLSKMFYDALYNSIAAKTKELQLSNCKEMLDTHYQILNAVEKRDESAAKDIIGKHLEKFAQVITDK